MCIWIFDLSTYQMQQDINEKNKTNKQETGKNKKQKYGKGKYEYLE